MIGGDDEELQLPLESEHEEEGECEGKVEVPDIVVSGEEQPSWVRTLRSSRLL